MSQQLHGEQLPKLPDELNEVLAARTFTTDHSSVLCSKWREDIFSLLAPSFRRSIALMFPTGLLI